MKLYTLSKDVVEIHIDLDTVTIVQLINKVTESRYLFSRKSELELRAPGMGIIEIEPTFCNNWRITKLKSDGFIAECSTQGYYFMKVVNLGNGFVEYEYRIKNTNSKSVKARPRVAIYIACARGGFWGDEGVEGAINTCRYFVDYGYSESWGTFSTTATPGTPRGYMFEKHSYRSRWFPEVRWLAFVDVAKREGIVVQCLSEGCYASVEDQFFNIEVNLAIPAKLLMPGEEITLRFRLIPFNDLTRVDYVDEDVVVGVEGPSIALPGDKYRGSIQVYSLKKLETSVSGRIVFVRGMQSIGKRGYCVDRVVPDKRAIGLVLAQERVALEMFRHIEIGFESSKALDWSFERELYEISYIEVSIGNKVIRKAISINPDVEDALSFVPPNLAKLSKKHLLFNPAVESEYLEREASKPIYSLVSSMRFSPRKILRNLGGIIEKSVEDALVKFLSDIGVEQYIDLWQRKVLNPVIVSRTPILSLALAYMVTKSEKILNAIANLLKSFEELVLNDTFITYYSSVHGGGGADRFADYAIALDIVEDVLPKEIVEGAYQSLRIIADEVSKLTNTWTGNWELSEATALLTLSYKLGYPGNDIDFYRALATARRALKSFLADGAWPELAASYHVASLSHLIKMAEFLRYVGCENLYTYTTRTGEEPVIKKALMWLWSILTPYDTVPALEDANEFTPSPDTYLLPGLALNDNDLLGIAQRLYRRVKRVYSPWTLLAMINYNKNPLLYEYLAPARRKIALFEDSGRFVYRESEDEKALYIVLDFGPQGGWHGHPDRLSFEVYYYGEPIIVDAGSGGYYDPLHWTWSRRSVAHNTVTLGDSDLPEYVRGYLLGYEELGNGFRASFKMDTSVFVLERTLALEIQDELRRITINDVVRGKGLFRWNIHCRGSIVEYRGNAILFRTPKGVEVFIEAPQDSVFSVGEGYRGSSEKTIYLYYEKQVDNIGSLRGVITLKKALS